MTQNFDPRVLSGDGKDTPPHLEPLSRSEGDLNRNSYRPSMYNRLAQRAVANDDGTPITQSVEVLLQRLLEISERMVTALKAIESQGKR